MPRLALSWIGLCALSACSQDREVRRRELEEISSRHVVDVAALERARSELEERRATPQRLDFGTGGTILVEECALRGHVGRERLWVRFTFVNTSGRAIDAATVSLQLRDPKSGLDWTEELDLGMPLLRLGPGSTYTTHFDVPTRGIHLHPGWSWEIRARTIVKPRRDD